MEKGRAVSVRLDNGEVIGLDGVLASNVDPRHLALDLLGEAQIGESVAQKIGDSPSSAAVVWLGYPLVYAAYSLIHGAVTGFYPYPFINVSNMAVLVLVFLGLGLALIGIDRRMGRSNEQAAGAAT